MRAGRFAERIEAGDELQIAQAPAAERAVDLIDIPGGARVHDRENVELDAGILQQLNAVQDGGIRAFSGLRQAEGVVRLLGAVERHAEKKMIVAEEFGPLLRQKRAVGLQGVVDRQAAGVVLVLQLHRKTEKVEAAQRRLAALVGDGHVVLSKLKDAAHQIVERLLGHHAVGGLLALFRQVTVKAVLTVQVALARGGLDQKIDWRHNITSFPDGRGVPFIIYRFRGRVNRAGGLCAENQRTQNQRAENRSHGGFPRGDARDRRGV